MTTTFRSAVDTWFYLVIAASGLALAAASVTAWTAGSTFALAIVGVSSLAAVGFPVWMLRTTTYTVAAEHLEVRCGPFRWLIRREEIRSIQATRSPLSSPALSLNRLEIRYGVGRSILVSPEDRDGFLQALGVSPGDGLARPPS